MQYLLLSSYLLLSLTVFLVVCENRQLRKQQHIHSSTFTAAHSLNFTLITFQMKWKQKQRWTISHQWICEHFLSIAWGWEVLHGATCEFLNMKWNWLHLRQNVTKGVKCCGCQCTKALHWRSLVKWMDLPTKRHTGVTWPTAWWMLCIDIQK